MRQIQFIKDISVSTPSHPVYALLVSREIQSDQSHLADDALTAEAKQAIKDERDKKKMAKQVEADLGGFDIENEWVEEIEREECFEIEKRYGGSPPISTSLYEIWVSLAIAPKPKPHLHPGSNNYIMLVITRRLLILPIGIYWILFNLMNSSMGCRWN